MTISSDHLRPNLTHAGFIEDRRALCPCGFKGTRRPYPYLATQDLLDHYRERGKLKDISHNSKFNAIVYRIE